MLPVGWVQSIFTCVSVLCSAAVGWVMVLFAVADLLTGYFGKDLVINEMIYKKFFYL